MRIRSCFVGFGLSVLLPVLSGIDVLPLSAKAEDSVLVAQQSESTNADALFEEGKRLREEGSADSLRQAIDVWKRALALYENTGNRAREATTLSNIGFVYYALGEREQALSYYEQSLPLFRTVGEPVEEASILNNIGAVYYALGEREQALSYYEQSLPLSRAVGDRAGEASILNNIGVVYNALGEREQALSYYEQSLLLFRAVGDRAGEAATLNSIGFVYDELGDREQALSYYEQSLLLSRAVGDRAVSARTLTNIGFIYAALGEREQALSYYKQSLSLRRTVGDRAGEAATLNNISFVYAALGEREQALSYLEQSLLLRRTVGDRAGEAATLNNIGFIYAALGEREQALSYYEQSLSLGQAVGDRVGEVSVLANMALLHQQQNKLSDALSAINNAVGLIEGLRLNISSEELRTSYFSTVQVYYKIQLDIQMQLGQSEAAFETSEAARARLLTELLTESNVDIRQGVSPELLQAEQSLQAELAQIEQHRIALRSGDHTPEQATDLNRQSDKILQQLDQVVAQIRRASPAYAEIVQPQPLTLTQIQQQVLDSNTVLLQYTLGEEQSYLWIVSQNNFQSYTLPAAADIQAVAARFQSAVSIQGTPASEAKRQGDELVSLILPEMPDWIADKRLVVAGDGILSELPFAALPLPNQTDYVPLLTAHEVLTQPSITAISVLREQFASRQQLTPSLAVLADPVYRADDDRIAQASSKELATRTIQSVTERNLRDLDLRVIERLPYTRTEADNILQLAANNNLKNISALDFEASTDWVNAPELENYSIVHMATHGFINPVNPQLSGLVLSLVNETGQLKENGFLRLHDIFNLKLAAELVVLSACQTGNGEAISGEGIVGLSRGFMYAGAERVAVSLWNVNDQATAELMSTFYRYLLEEKMTPAAAMRAAQLEAWQAGQSPYLWAAFTLQGEWTP